MVQMLTVYTGEYIIYLRITILFSIEMTLFIQSTYDVLYEQFINTERIKLND